jgi:hypothetical protein
MNKSIFTALLACSLFALNVQAMTVAEAYAAIPHQRTIFNLRDSKLPLTQASALQKLFNFSDHGTVLRIEGLSALRSGDMVAMKRSLADYNALVASFAAQQAPADIQPIQDLVAQAIKGHQRYLEAKLKEREVRGTYDPAFTQEVRQASRQLQQAYGMLMRTFPNESANNKTAFYDYLCALDFL